MKNHCKELKLQTSSTFLVLYENLVKALVEWRGWPEKINSWIPLSDLQKKYERLLRVSA